MRHALAHQPALDLRLRKALPSDVDQLVEVERRAFRTNRITRRGFQRFIAAPSATIIVAEESGTLSGYTLVLYRRGSSIARLYSLAVSPRQAGLGLGRTLLAAAEDDALARDCVLLRLEVHERNARAIALYRANGYNVFDRVPDYYEDGAGAWRLEKRLSPPLPTLTHAPPYFHQTTEFTCGPACAMMALAWADPKTPLTPGLEFRLWREATTIFMTSGHGGCDPFGLAVTLKRHGLAPEIHVSRAGPYFLDTVRSDEKRRVMRLTQEDFRREAKAMSIPVHLTHLRESVLMDAFDEGAAAIVLVSGYHMVRRRVPHWVFAFGREGRYVLVHDPAAQKSDNGSISAATFAVPWDEFERMMRFGRDLRAAVLIRKEPPP